MVLFNSDIYKSAPSVATVIIASSLFKSIYLASFTDANIFAIAEKPNSGRRETKSGSKFFFSIKKFFPISVLKIIFKLLVA